MKNTNPFLKTLSEQLFRDYGEDIRDVCMVFPNRRAGVFFKKYLASAAGKTIWSPRIFTINEFMQHLSSLSLADPVDLVFEVYKTYAATTQEPESLDEFWHWGEMMLADFDDLDKYLVDAGSVYANIRDLREIDAHFDLSDEQKEIIRRFWGYFKTGDLSSQKESFLKIWNILLTVYSGLNENLSGAGLAYEGMIYKGVANDIKAGKYPEIPWKKVIVCGFNALNNSERELFRYLRKSGRGRFFWDYDEFYTSDAESEAGRFMRTNLAEFPPDCKLEDFDNIHNRNVSIYELPSDIAQAKYLNTLLKTEKPGDLVKFNHTALVLGDEDLLIPVLTSMPGNVEDINITMGYPMSSTPVYSFADHLLRMQKNIGSRKGKRKDRFYFRDVLAILNHQYLKLGFEKVVLEKIREINNKNLIYLDTSFFQETEILKLIFRKVEDVTGMADYISDILLEVAEALGQGEQDLHRKLEKEYLYLLLSRLNKLKAIFNQHDQKAGIDTFTRVFRKILKNMRIPFEGEPLAGLQIMGILETRLLDFDHVVFLSLNEGVMPRSHQSFSYIPNNLRYAYGMPTHEDQDAIYAYYFFRLVQRASRVTIFYNSGSDGSGSGERSRYIYQMLYNKRFVTDFKSVGFNISSREALPISIPKTKEILEIFKKFSPSSAKYLSPSALSTYITCRLKFYFNYVAGLKEVDTISEEIEADTLGNLLHSAMHEIYRPFGGKIVKPEDFQALKDIDNLKVALDSAFRKVYYKTDKSETEVVPEGKNIIVYEMLKQYINRILEIDFMAAPFEILSLETEYKTRLHIDNPAIGFELGIGGKIDRVDKKNGSVRIIDYKTGKAIPVFDSIESLFIRDNKKFNKPAFQTILYSWLYSRESQETNINPGLYVTKNLFDDEFDPMLKMKKVDFNFFETKNEFEERLITLISEIVDENVPFDQTTLQDNCEYCPYSDICHRNKIKK